MPKRQPCPRSVVEYAGRSFFRFGLGLNLLHAVEYVDFTDAGKFSYVEIPRALA